jgi:uncharacterized protein YdhG (YjbR/CyaY superfamily)
MSAEKAPQQSARGDKTSQGFTDEERAAMKERAREVKAEARASKNRAEGERDLLAKIAEMPGADRALAERVHAIVSASAPDLMPKTWYGMPAYARDGKVVSFRARTSSTRGMRPSASATRRTSTRAPCGRPPSR